MRTRCPSCSTVFRVTPEQLRLKSGKVRCGQCHAVFNAFDSLIEDKPAPAPVVADAAEMPPVFPADNAPDVAPFPVEAAPSLPTAAQETPPAAPETPAVIPASIPIADEADAAQRDDFPTDDPVPAATTAATLPEDTGTATAPEIATDLSLPETHDTPDTPAGDATHAAREAGLVAARELTDTPGFNRWAAGTLAAPDATFHELAAPTHRLPFTVATVILGLCLLLQAAYQLRTSIVQHLPSALSAYQALDIDVPLPAVSDLVAIDSSDLQSDNARGLLLLQANLRNRAAFAQAWPALELTLTDTHDTVITRRVLSASEYLPPGTDPAQFPARHELAIRLWLDGKELGAAGYRLYVFYP